MTEKKEKDKAISLGSELRKVQSIPLDRLSIQLGVEPETAKLTQNLIRDFLDKHWHEEGNHKSDNNPNRPIFFHKSGCTCKWCELE